MTLEALRHTTSHVLAQAVKRLYPDAKLGIGPAIDEGFYYDFDLSHSLSVEDLSHIEDMMKTIINENLPITQNYIPREAALKFMQDNQQPYKAELIRDIPESEDISFFTQGEFTDLCRGPHLPSTQHIGAFKLLRISGAYWRGKETNPMLQRIYGTVFPNETELNDYLHFIEEAEKRDHRKLGQSLDLFSIQDKTGSGLIYWHPKGALIRHLLESFWKNEHFAHGYDLLNTPHIGQSWLWETSGHLGFYKENMYASMVIDEQNYYLKPMNCPFHIMIYKSTLRSYKDLPLRWAELGTVYRYERSGVLHGLLRVRGFTQDDAHIFCTPDQVVSEIEKVIEFSKNILKTLGFSDLTYYLSTRPEQSVGNSELWIHAEHALRLALEKLEIHNFFVDEGGGAFYGPKIDIKIKDALKREWQLSTIQFDFNMPERFDMSYIGSDGNRHRPYMIHRALFGSLERFFGILIEHYAGKFPFWLSPVQYIILTVNNNSDVVDFTSEIKTHLSKLGFRGEIDNRNEKLGAKIRDAQQQLIPFMLVIGDSEAKSRQISVRKRSQKETSGYSLEQVASLFQELNINKNNN